MATIQYLTKDFTVQRRSTVVNPPGMTTPLFLGSKYDGEVIEISGVIQGSSYSDALSVINTLRAAVKTNEQITIGTGSWGTLPSGEQLTGKIERFVVAHRPASKYQRFNLSLKVYT